MPFPALFCSPQWKSNLLSFPAAFVFLASQLGIWLTTSFSVRADGFGGKHVLVVGIDGLRSDALQAASAPTLKGLAAAGAVSWDAYAGGILNTPTQQRTVSGPGWGSIVTGVWTDKHHITDNSFAGYQSANFPHFFRRIAEFNPNAYLSSIVEWAPVNDSLVGPVAQWTRFKQLASDGDTQDLAAKTVAHLKSADPDVVFLHFDTVDLTGHSTGFSPVNPAYLGAIASVDRAVAQILAAIKTRPLASEEQWLVVVVTDHGGTELGHGNQSPQERMIPLIVSGPGVQPQVISPGPGHTCVPPTILAYLGIPMKPEWGWAEVPFGLDSGPIQIPKFISQPLDKTITEGLPTQFAAGVAGVSVQLQWLKEGMRIGQETNSVLTLSNVTLSDAGHYSLEASNSAGSITSNPALLTVMPRRYHHFTNGLVAHLPMDGDYKDSSGNTNHGTPRGKVGFGPGKVGSGSMRFTTKKEGTEFSYVTLGTRLPRILASNDFSIALWINVTNYTDDPPLVSNKDWSSGNNTGFVIACQPGGFFKENFKGASGLRVDSSGEQISDGAWHHVVVCYERRADARIYLDGQLTSTASIADSQGSVDSRLPLNLGQDGTGTYTYGATVGILNAYLDDFGLWSRSLSQEEVESLYLEALDGRSFGNLPHLSIRMDGEELIFEWEAYGMLLEWTETLQANAIWHTVPDAQSGLHFPRAFGTGYFFRLRER